MLRVLVTSFALMSTCMVAHTVGLVSLAYWLIKHHSIAKAKASIIRYTLLLASVFASIVALHLVETLIWATYYNLWGLFSDFETSWYFSVGSYTTIGYGDVVLPPKWRMLGGFEGITGVLLCGLSTAFLFAVVNQMFVNRTRRFVEGPDEDD